MKTITLQLTKFFSLENLILKTKLFFKPFVTKLSGGKVVGEKHQQGLQSLVKNTNNGLKHQQRLGEKHQQRLGEKHQQGPALKKKSPAASLSFIYLPNKLLIRFANHVLVCMQHSMNSSLPDTSIEMLTIAVMDMENAYRHYTMEHGFTEYEILKARRNHVELLLSALAKNVNERAKEHPESERIIITGAGFEVRE